MDYYKRRTEASRIINKMLNEGKSYTSIEWVLVTKYGFNQKMLDKHLDLRERVAPAREKDRKKQEREERLKSEAQEERIREEEAELVLMAKPEEE